MNKAWQVAQRDMRYHLGKKDFYWATFGVPITILIITLVVRLFGGSNPVESSGIAGLLTSQAQTIGFVDQAGVISSTTGVLTSTTFVPFADQASGEAALRAEQIEVLYLIPADYLSTGQITRTAAAAGLLGLADANAFRTLLTYNTMSQPRADLAQRIHNPLQLGQITRISAGSRASGDLFNNFRESLIPIGFALAIYASIFMGASLLMQGVLEEKENRTLEVLLTSLTPRQFLLGKIIGLGVVGLLQLLIWSLIGAITLRSGVTSSSIDTPSVQLPWTIWLLAGGFFITGYLFYASLMGGIGAISPSMRELSQLTILISIPALVPILCLPLLLSQPNGSLALILSLIPFTASATMMMRQALTEVPLWQTLLSLGVMVLAVSVTLSLTARLFKATTLLAGAKISGRALWRALK